MTTVTEPQITRRHLGTFDGLDLIFGEGATQILQSANEWVAKTGLDHRRVFRHSLCASPLPIYLSEPSGPRQFSEVRPEMMWHPLFWLPTRLASPYTIVGGNPETGETLTESDLGWSLRVALEMGMSGLYSQHGGWMDVLAPLGIDVSTPEGQQRVADWQAGAPDEDLDNLNLDEYLLVQDDPMWSAAVAAELEQTATDAHWALLCDSLLELFTDAEVNPDFDKARSEAAATAHAATLLLPGCPGPQGAPPAGPLFDQVRAAAEGWTRDRAAFQQGPLSTAQRWVRAVRDQFWPAVEALNGQPVDTQIPEGR